jgi:hypothetical protein
MLHFGYVAQWEAFRGVVISKQLFARDNASLPRHRFFFTRFTAAGSRHVWMLIKGYINQLCGETPPDLRMGVPAPTTSFVGLDVKLTETQRKATIHARDQKGQDAHKLEEWLEMQPQRFTMPGINPDS